MMKIFFSTLIIIILVVVGFSMNPTITTTTIIPVHSQGDSVYIVPQAADPNNDQSFVPKFISIPIQSIVTWTNDDSIQHTVTSDEEGLKKDYLTQAHYLQVIQLIMHLTHQENLVIIVQYTHG
jgi:hypothetical protein